MKLYITGTTAVGKTFISRKLSESLNIPFYELDNLLWIRRKTGDVRRSDDEVMSLLNNIIKNEDWIIEDIGRDVFKEGLVKADKIIFLDIPKRIRTKRIIKRYINKKLGLEQFSYKINFKLLKKMLKRNKDFEKGRQDFMDKLQAYKNKLYIIDKIDYKKVIESIKQIVED